jgi:glycosyltransferase involved in cell wall biosynthesis
VTAPIADSRSPSVGIVVPCRNEAQSVCEVLDAVAAQDRPPDQVVLVDDGSTDGTAEAIAGWQRGRATPAVQVIAGPGRGVAAAVNAGIAALRTEIVLRLDGHCRPAADYVRRVVALSVQSGVGVAGGAWTIRPGAPTLEAEAMAIAVAHPLGSGGVAYRRPLERCPSLRSADYQVRGASRQRSSVRGPGGRHGAVRVLSPRAVAGTTGLR